MGRGIVLIRICQDEIIICRASYIFIVELAIKIFNLIFIYFLIFIFRFESVFFCKNTKFIIICTKSLVYFLVFESTKMERGGYVSY